VREVLQQFGPENEILKEQYLDFLKGRSFRQTLLCRREIKLKRTIDAQLIGGFFISAAKPLVSAEPDLRPGSAADFTGAKGARLQTDFPLAKAALLKLSEAGPRGLAGQDLLQSARLHLELTAQREQFDPGELDAEQMQVLNEVLFAAYCSGLIELHLQMPPIPSALSARPQAEKFVRWQAEHELPLTNLFHKTSQLEDALSQQLLRLCDGTRTRADLLTELTAFAAAQGLRQAGRPITTAHEISALLAHGLEQNLQKLLYMGLLSA
jgi:methyltransferase-like protein